jgi:hypothetical protein
MSNFAKSNIKPHIMQALKVLFMLFMDEAFILTTVCAYIYTHIVFLIMASDSLLTWVKIVTIILTFIPAFGLGCLKLYREWNKVDNED